MRKNQSSVSKADANQAKFDPRPDGREGAQQEADERVAEVTFGDLMCRRGAGEGERDDEDEVVEELQTGRDPPLLVRIATGHRA